MKRTHPTSTARPYPVKADRPEDFVRLGRRFERAMRYALEMHREQARKHKPNPYAGHLLGVASIVLEHGGSERQAIAALLHDTIEDCGSEHARPIRKRFGRRVLEMVRACSDSEVPAGTPKADWRQRKQAYLDHLGSLPAGDPALLVSASDKLHNARAIVEDLRRDPDWLSRFRTGEAEDQRWYYRALADIFCDRMPGPLADELRRTVDELHALSIGGEPPLSEESTESPAGLAS